MRQRREPTKRDSVAVLHIVAFGVFATIVDPVVVDDSLILCVSLLIAGVLHLFFAHSIRKSRIERSSSFSSSLPEVHVRAEAS